MVFFNYSTMQMAAKIVYYGPGLCGKTTNLQYIYSHTENNSRGEMVSLETETDRTLFFDLLPIDVGSIAGFATRIQLYTVPGQVFYNTTRKLVLKGVDGVVFVADSQRPTLQANIDSFRNLQENLEEMGLSVDTMPLVLQYNKRDLQDICSVEELDQALNRGNWPAFEASAITGTGIFETLKGVSKLTLLSLKKRLTKATGASVPMSQVAGSGPGPTAPRPGGPAPRPTTVPAGQTSGQPETGASRGAAPMAAPPRPTTPPSATAAPATAAVPAAAAHASAPARLRPATPRPKAQTDVLAELESIRRQTLQARPLTPPATPIARNGRHEINRDIQLTLDRADFGRARRFLLSCQVADGENQVVETISDFQVELGDLEGEGNVVLRLSIALRSKD